MQRTFTKEHCGKLHSLLTGWKGNLQFDAFSSTDSDNSFVGDLDIVDISFLDCHDKDTEKDIIEETETEKSVEEGSPLLNFFKALFNN